MKENSDFVLPIEVTMEMSGTRAKESIKNNADVLKAMYNKHGLADVIRILELLIAEIKEDL